MSEEQVKDLLADDNLEHVDEELSEKELNGVAGGVSTKPDFKGLTNKIWSEEPPDNIRQHKMGPH